MLFLLRQAFKPPIPNPSLVHLLIPTHNIGQTLDQWVSKGNQVSATELQLQIGVLCKRNQWSEALQVYVAYLRKMHEMGFISSPRVLYNGIMCLYTNGGRHEKVPGVLADMKENNISPDNLSHRICINSYGVRSDLEGVEKVLKEIKSQPHIVRGWNTYAVVADFYMKAGQMEKAVDALKKSEGR